MARLFIGLSLPDSVAEPLARLVQGALAEPQFRIYPARDLHVTLCFLGEHPNPTQVARALGDETRGLFAPELRLAGVGAFPSLEDPRALWAGVEEEEDSFGRLDALRNRARNAALGAGWRMPASERARPFRPHVTVARPRVSRERMSGEVGAPRPPAGVDSGGGARAAIPAAFLGLRPRGSFLVPTACLYDSDPGRPEERYRVLAETPLAVRPG
ncbi:MAG: RNA 2',3'-cyclic phosphodiesterase [Planctomycetota bacterium]